MSRDNPLVFYQGTNLPSGRILPLSKVSIPPHDRGFMFADAVYEVIRTYNGRLFALKEHLARLSRSLAATRIRFRDFRLIERKALELIRRNGLQQGDAMVYVQITRGAYPRQHAFPGQRVLPTVYIETARLVSNRAKQAKGVAAILMPDIRWLHCDIKSVGLLPNVLARQTAVERGAYEAIFVRQGTLTEGTHTNVFGVQRGRVITYPRTNEILGGITRNLVLRLCRRLKIPVRQTGLRKNRLRELDELFLAGTTAEVLPVISVDGRSVGTGRPGPVTRRLQSEFRDYVTGQL